MRIGMITVCYLPVINGVTRMVSLYQRHLADRGHEVTVFTLGTPLGAESSEDVVRSPGIPLGEGYAIAPGLSRAARARLQQMDVVHCHHPLMGLDLARRYCRCPVVFTNHTRYDLYLNAYLRIPPRTSAALMRFLWPRIGDLADVVVAPSPSMRDVLRRFGVRGEIEVIPNGIELESVRRPSRPVSRAAMGLAPGDCLGIYVGRLTPEKRVDALLSAFARARSAAPNFHLLLLGSGKQRERLARQARRRGIARYVRFVPEVAPAEVPDYLAAADLFVTASRSEAHPLAVIEAMAAGLPVAGCRTPGLVDLIQTERNGLLVTPDEEALASAMVRLSRDRELRRRLGRTGRQKSLEFDIAHTVACTEDLYGRLVRRPHSR